MMWTCPICKTTNETNKCRSCGFDKSKDYTNHRSFARFPSPAVKSSNRRSPETIFSWRAAMQTMFLEEKWTGNRLQPSISGTRKENIGEDAWGVSEKQNGSIMAWTEEKRDGFRTCTLQRTKYSCE